MFIKHKGKIVNLEHATSIVNKGGKISVYYGDKNEVVGEFTSLVARENIDKIFSALERGCSTIEI